MATSRKVFPTRKQRDRARDNDSQLLRSAEALGRVIGALRRQLDEATRRLSAAPRRRKSSARTARKKH
jgi:hypothetical protein